MLGSLRLAVLLVGAVAAFASAFIGSPAASTPQQQEPSTVVKPQNPDSGQKNLDPAGWGSNHVGKPVPEFVHGDECLFCHRNDIGPGWQRNPHGITLRQREDAPEFAGFLKSNPTLAPIAAQVEYFLGSRQRVRFLKKEGYGKLALLNTQAVLGDDRQPQKWIDSDKPEWDSQRFANRCAGCHATGVDSSTRSFAAFGLDCYTCHGVVSLDHTRDTSLIFLSKKQRSDARTIISTCAQCHLRTGKSKSTGLPYPNNFVPGDNLFQDYEVDFARVEDSSLNAGDRHVLRNVREVVVNGSEFPTCISCHDLHKQSSVKHRRAPRTSACIDCHNAQGPLNVIKRYVVSSSLCEY